MNNLIIGASGKIGFYYHKRTKLKNNIFISRKENKKKRFLKFDFENENFIDFVKKKKISKVIIFTAISDPLKCKINKKESHKINIILIKKIINILIEENIYFIFFSTEYIFSGRDKVLYKENSKTNSRMLYGKQKIEIENYLKKKNYNNFSILRLSKTYGDNINDKTLFSEVLEQYINGKKLFEIANDQCFKPLYINDLIKILDYFLRKKITGNFNVCGDQYMSRFNFIKIMFKFLNINDVILKTCSIKKFDNKIHFPKKLNLSNKKIKNKIGIKFTNFTKILKIIYA